MGVDVADDAVEDADLDHALADLGGDVGGGGDVFGGSRGGVGEARLEGVGGLRQMQENLVCRP